MKEAVFYYLGVCLGGAMLAISLYFLLGNSPRTDLVVLGVCYVFGFTMGLLRK